MPPSAKSEHGQPPFLGVPSTTTIPDLTDKIIRQDNQYCEAGGSFGDVFRCRYTGDDGVKEVAVKAFRFSFSVDEHKHKGKKDARMIRRELGIWSRLSHHNIVPFLGIVYGFGRQGNASLVSVWMPHGTLHTFLETHDNQLAVAHRLQLLLDIANGLHYLHSFSIVHGDLSSNNVLLDHNYNACLTDFGCASLVGKLPAGFTYLQASTGRPGTLRWAAPEHFSIDENGTEHTIKSDIYSFGNMALLVLSGKYPWSEVQVDAAVMLQLSLGRNPGRPLVPPIDDRHWAFIERCWLSIPERPLAEEVVSSLQQLLGAYPPPSTLCDLLDVPTSSSSVQNCPSHDDLDNVMPMESPLDPPQSRIPTDTPASALPPAPENIPRCPDPLISSPDRVPRPLPQALTQHLASQQRIVNELGEGARIYRPLAEDARDHSHDPSPERPLDMSIFETHSNNTVVARGLPTYLNEAQVHEFLQAFGKIKTCTLIREGDGNGPSKGIAFFEYVDASVTDVAVRSLNGTELGDGSIVVQRAGTLSLDTDETQRLPLCERKARGNVKGKKPARADKDDSAARVGYSFSNVSGPSARTRHGVRAEETVPQKKQIIKKHTTDAPADSPPSFKWVRGTLLGTGTYGRVYLALDVSTGEMIAVKQVEKGNKDAQRLNFVSELKMEQETLKGLDHPNIVAYLGSEETPTCLSIFLEYVPGGTIASCLREHGRFDEQVIKSFTAQILEGLAYLHANHIIHRNIEANNILICMSGICKISGFGNAQRTDDDGASWTPMRGTVFWTAPEVIGSRDGKRYGPKVDIWSAGCVLLRMWMGGRGWRYGDVFALMVKATRQVTGRSSLLALGVILSDLALDFSDRCFAIDPEARASAAELVRHPYLTPEFTGFT